MIGAILHSSWLAASGGASWSTVRVAAIAEAALLLYWAVPWLAIDARRRRR